MRYPFLEKLRSLMASKTDFENEKTLLFDSSLKLSNKTEYPFSPTMPGKRIKPKRIINGKSQNKQTPKGKFLMGQPPKGQPPKGQPSKGQPPKGQPPKE